MATIDKVNAPRVPSPQPETTITRGQTLLFACAVSVIVTNLFAAQPLTGLIGPSLGLSLTAAGLVSMLTLLGYSAGLFFLVPLGDLLNNRPLILTTLGGAVVAAMAAAVAPFSWLFLITAFVLGMTSCVIQMLVPVAASLAPEARRGRVIGDVMSGLMIGILLSRPLASLIADTFGWRGFYFASSSAMAVLAAILTKTLPHRRQAADGSYPALIRSLWTLLRQEQVLRRRATTASLSMGAFSVFWTAIALRLDGTPFNFGQRGIALFAFVGVAGAVVAPLAGRAGDRGWTRPLTRFAHIGIIASMALAAYAGDVVDGGSTVPLVLMGSAAVLLDACVTVDQTLGRRAINLLSSEARSRLNGLFVGIFFLGGAVGSALAGAAWTLGGWPLVCGVAAGFGAAALIVGPVNQDL